MHSFEYAKDINEILFWLKVMTLCENINITANLSTLQAIM